MSRRVIPVLLLVLAVARALPAVAVPPLERFAVVLHVPALEDPGGARDFSGVSYDPDTGTLFVVDNRREDVYEYTTDGRLLRVIRGSGFDDTEGIVHLGGDRFAISEEKRALLDVVRIDGRTTSLDRARARLVQPSLGRHLEGVAYDPLAGVFYAVQEAGPLGVYRVRWDGTATLLPEVTAAAAARVTDLADLYVRGGPAPRLYLLSQESATLLELDLAGEVLGSLSLAELGGGAHLEGASFSPDGCDLYLVGEPREYLHLAAPCGLPWSLLAALAAGGLAVVAGLGLRARAADEAGRQRAQRSSG